MSGKKKKKPMSASERQMAKLLKEAGSTLSAVKIKNKK